MSRTVDERVVEMRFDNAQFESGVKTSMGTLDKLKAALKFDGASKGLDEVSKSTKNLDPSISAISKSVEALEKRFSAFGIVGMEVIRKLTDSALSFASNTLNKITDSIVSGGIRRAQNIEQAHFQLQGLLKDETLVQQIMAQAMDSVDGTAYGYDVAAKAASMFASSGIKAGHDMEIALKGLAGTTAMTGRDYESIANIFTTISGQGKILGNQLNQLASYGLNAAATMAKYRTEAEGIATTEEDIRAIISDPKTIIGFEEFANAMSWAFGDQAKKANETFNGALDNIKAALSRIGAKFISPLLEQNGALVKMFNAIRVRINDINKGIDPFATKVTGFIKDQAVYLTELLNSDNFIKGISNTMPKLFDIFDNLFISLQFGLKNLGSIIKPIAEGLLHFVPDNLLDRIVTLTNNLRLSVIQFHLSDETANKLQRTFSGVAAIFHIVGQAIGAVAKIFGVDLSDGIAGGISGILDFTARIGDWLINLDAAIDKGNIFENAIVSVARGIGETALTIKEFALNVASFVSTTLNNGITAFKNFANSIVYSFTGFANINELLNSIKSGFRDFINSIVPSVAGIDGIDLLRIRIERFVASIIDSFRNLSSIKITPPDFSFLNTLAEQFKNANNPLSGIADIFRATFEEIGKVLSIISPYIAKVFGFIGGAIQELWEKANGILKQTGGEGIFSKLFNIGLFAGIGIVIAEFSSHLISLSTVISTFASKLLGIDLTTIRNIAVSIGILSASLVAMSLVDSGKLYATLGVLTALIYELVAAMKTISGLLTSSKGGFLGGLENFMNSFAMSTITTGFIKMAGAMVVLAAAMKIIGSLNPQELITGLVGIGASLNMFVILFKSMPKDVAVNKAATSIFILSTAMTVLGAALHIIGSLNPNELITGLVGMGASLAIFVAVFNNMKAESIGKTAASILLLSVAMTVLGGALHVMGSLNAEQLISSLTALGISLAAMVIALRNMPTEGSTAKSAAALLLLSGALLVLGGALHIMGSLNVDQLVISLTALGGSLFIMVSALNTISSAGKAAGGAAAILLMSVALIALGGALKIFATIPLNDLGPALISMGGALAVVIAAGLAAIVAAPGLIALSVALGAIGLAVLAVGSGITALAAGLASLAVIGAAGAAAFVDVFSTILTGILDAIAESGESIKEAVVTIFMVVIEAFSEVASGFVNNVISLAETILDALIEHGPALVDKLIDFIVGILDTLTSRVPELVQSIVKLVSTIIDSVIEVVNGIDTSSLQNALEFSGIIAAFLLAMAGLSAIAAPAMVGVLAFGGLIVELTAVLAAVGAINKIPGLQSFVEGGGDLLQAVGTAIGQFIGGFVGGVAEGATASLPKIGENLSEFMTNVQPFLEGATKIDASMMDGVDALVGVVLAVTAASFLSAITTFLSGGLNFVAFGAQVKALGKAVSGFAESIDGIDASAVESAAHAAKMLAEVIKSVPSGGALDAIFGKNNMQEFGRQLDWLGYYLVKFAERVDGKVSEAAVQAAANAGKMMVELADSIPNTGGLLGMLAGENDMQEFGKQLDKFGFYLVKFSQRVDGKISESAVQAAANAGAMMVQLADTIPNTGGLLSFLAGDNDMKTFGEQLLYFGYYITDYSTKVANLDTAAIDNSIGASKSLVELADSLGVGGGLLQNIIGGQSLQRFGEELAGFGKHLLAYSIEAASLDRSAIAGSVVEIKKLIALANDISTINASAFGNFSQSLTTMAHHGIDSFANAFTNATSKVGDSINTMLNSAITTISNKTSNLQSTCQKAGETIGNSLISGMNRNKSMVSTTAIQICNDLINTFRSKIVANIWTQLGSVTIMQTFISAIQSKKAPLSTLIDGVCKDIVDTFTKILTVDTFIKFGEKNMMGSLMEGIKKKADDLLKYLKKLCEDIVKTFKDNLKEREFKKLGTESIKALISGFSDQQQTSALKKAVQNIGEVILAELKKFSKSDEIKDVGVNITKGIAEGIADKGAKSQVIAAIRKVIQEAVKEAKKTSKEKSPSKVFAEIGKFFDLGMAEGIDEYAGDVASSTRNLSQTAIDSMRQSLRSISDIVDGELDYTPTITPVIDLSNIQNGSRKMRGLITKGLNTSIAYNNALLTSVGADNLISSGGNSTTTTNNYNFTQNNYSPKALSRKEIYRQTKNQFSALKGAVSG